MGCPHVITSLNTIHLVKFAGYSIADPKPGGVLDRHPGKYHPGKFNDAKEHKQQDREGNDKFHHSLTPIFCF